MAKWLIVMTFDVEDPNVLADVIKQINPPSLEGFSGSVRLTTDPVATNVEEWLDE